MTYIHLSTDKSLTVTQADKIYRGDNLSSAITFLIPLKIGDVDVSETTVFLCYVRPDGVPDIVTLTRDTSMYNSAYYKYAIPVTCKLSKYPGHVCMWLEFYSGDSLNPTIQKTGECNINILEKQNIGDCLDDCHLTALYQMHAEIEKIKSNGVGGGNAPSNPDDGNGNQPDDDENNDSGSNDGGNGFPAVDF